jgi:hypothetical protein
MSFNAILVFAIFAFFTSFVAQYDTAFGCGNRRRMGPSAMRIRAFETEFTEGW